MKIHRFVKKMSWKQWIIWLDTIRLMVRIM